MKFVRLDFVLLRSLATLVVVLAITLSGWWPAGGVSSAAEMPIGATLKVLAAPVDGRLFFAGEATSPNFFSTAHGARDSGERAAREVIQSR